MPEFPYQQVEVRQPLFVTGEVGAQPYETTQSEVQQWQIQIANGSLNKWQTTLAWKGMEQAETRGMEPPLVYTRGVVFNKGEYEYEGRYQGTPRAKLIQANRDRAAVLRMNIARRRALRLLLAHLTADQQREWEEAQAFHVETADGSRRYLIRRGMHGNITLVKADGPVKEKHGKNIGPGAQFCWCTAHPDGPIPVEDNVLAQKLMLETQEGEQQFLAQANVA